MRSCDPIIANGSHRTDRKAFLFDLLRALATAGLLIWFVYASGAGLGYNWQWYRVPKYLYTISEGHFLAGPLLKGLLVPLQVSAVSLVLSSLIGLVTAAMSLCGLLVGHHLGKRFGRVMEILGGCVLIFIGVKILIEHLSE